jgi:hypothetical protein
MRLHKNEEDALELDRTNVSSTVLEIKLNVASYAGDSTVTILG